MDGRTRFKYIESRPIGNLRQMPNNYLWSLWLNLESREEISRLTLEAFEHHFVLDPLDTQNIRIRLSRNKPPREYNTVSINPQLSNFLDEARPIESFGDGVQVYVGLIAALNSLKDRLILIDEPEVFLHPPLVRRLGEHLTDLARERKGSLLVATHSADFLQGSLNSTAKASIIRLTYTDGVATARELNQSSIRKINTDPLLRSAGLLTGLFHEAVIVTEGNTDRVFYEEINSRLLNSGEGIRDALFLSSFNWKTEERLIQPLRYLGVPTAAILDLDVINEGKVVVWHDLLAACGVPKNQWKRIIDLRDKLLSAFNQLRSKRNNALKRGGMNKLPTADQEIGWKLLRTLKNYGIFIVPTGELESWFASLNIRGRRTTWLMNLFKKIGTSEDDPNYLSAGTGDVWDFLSEIKTWLDDSARRGMEVTM
jgi:hypothetical protein